MSASADTPRIIVQALEPHYREAAGQWARRLGLELAEEGAADFALGALGVEMGAIAVARAGAWAARGQP